MNPQRHNISFPISIGPLIAAIDSKLKRLAEVYDEAVDDEEAVEREIAAYREKLRQVGVRGWETAFPDELRTSSYYNNVKQRRGAAAREILELQKWKSGLEMIQDLDPHRQFKLNIEDLEFFGLV